MACLVWRASVISQAEERSAKLQIAENNYHLLFLEDCCSSSQPRWQKEQMGSLVEYHSIKAHRVLIEFGYGSSFRASTDKVSAHATVGDVIYST